MLGLPVNDYKSICKSFFFQQSINYQQNINNIHPPVSVSQRLTLFSVPSDPATDIAILNQCIFAVDSRPQGPTVGEGRQVNLLNKELRNVKAADPTVWERTNGLPDTTRDTTVGTDGHGMEMDGHRMEIMAQGHSLIASNKKLVTALWIIAREIKKRMYTACK